MLTRRALKANAATQAAAERKTAYLERCKDLQRRARNAHRWRNAGDKSCPTEYMPLLTEEEEKDGWLRYDFYPFAAVTYKVAPTGTIQIRKLVIPGAQREVKSTDYPRNSGVLKVLHNKYCERCNGYNLHLYPTVFLPTCVCSISMCASDLELYAFESI